MFARRVAVSALLVAVSALAPSIGSGAADPSGPVEVDTVTSSADGTHRVEHATRLVTPATGDGPTVEVATDRARQRLRGVGASLTESSAYLIAGLPAPQRHALLSELFDPTEDGLSVVRIVIGASDFSLTHVSLDDSDTPDPTLSKFSIDRDRQWVIPVLREILAIAPDVEIIASPWSAPGWMKDTDNYLYGRLRTDYEGVYADYLTRFVEAYRDEGVPVDWLTVQNEPAAIQTDVPSMVMDADQQTRLIVDDLGPRLAAAGLDTRVLAWDHNWCDAQPPGGCVGSGTATFPLQVLQGAGGAYPLGGVAFHCYGGDHAAANDSIHDAWPNLEVWQTECSGGTWQGAPFDDTARLVVTDWNHWATASLLWNLALDPSGGPHLGGCGTCRGVVTVDPATQTWSPNVERDVLGAVTAFGPADSGVLETNVTNASRLEATGVCSPEGRPAAIVLNTGGTRTVTVRFSSGDGTLDLPIEVAADSLTAVRAPTGVTCERSARSDLPAAPTTTGPPTTTAPTSSAPASTDAPTSTHTVDPVTAPVATPVAAQPTFTG